MMGMMQFRIIWHFTFNKKIVWSKQAAAAAGQRRNFVKSWRWRWRRRRRFVLGSIFQILSRNKILGIFPRHPNLTLCPTTRPIFPLTPSRPLSFLSKSLLFRLNLTSDIITFANSHFRRIKKFFQTDVKTKASKGSVALCLCCKLDKSGVILLV